jgi:transposase
MVAKELTLNPLGGSIFAFSNRRRTVVKLLWWDKNGFAIWHKRLEKEKFRWPESRAQVLEIGARELRWLLDGLNVQQTTGHRELKYATVY